MVKPLFCDYCNQHNLGSTCIFPITLCFGKDILQQFPLLDNGRARFLKGSHKAFTKGPQAENGSPPLSGIPASACGFPVNAFSKHKIEMKIKKSETVSRLCSLLVFT